MVKVIYKPIKEVVIFECVYYPNLELFTRNLRVLMRLGQPVLLAWAEGILFTHTSLSPATDKVVSELMEGRVFWPSVAYTVLPKYQPVIKVNALEIHVVDVSLNPVLREVAIWLKNRINQFRINSQ
ncbi:MAG: hypothetical protein NDF55_07905 [archaeon GB-1867-005]|nr:hypothetical protein [Candidatus Culexmicrobium cathedralense]